MLIQSVLTYRLRGSDQMVRKVIKQTLPDINQREVPDHLTNLVMADVRDYQQMLARTLYRVADHWHLEPLTPHNSPVKHG